MGLKAISVADSWHLSTGIGAHARAWHSRDNKILKSAEKPVPHSTAGGSHLPTLLMHTCITGRVQCLLHKTCKELPCVQNSVSLALMETALLWASPSMKRVRHNLMVMEGSLQNLQLTSGKLTLRLSVCVGVQVALGGDSAGANMTCVLAQRLRDNSGPKLALQVPLFPETALPFDGKREPNRSLLRNSR